MSSANSEGIPAPPDPLPNSYRHPESPCAGTRGWAEHRLVFPSKRGNALAHPTIRATRQRVSDMSGLDWVSMICLRHTYASLLVEGGMSPAQVAKLLGHADDQLVLRAYFDAGPITHDRAAAVVTAAYTRARPKTAP